MNIARFAQIQRMLEDIESNGYGDFHATCKDGEWILFEKTIKEKPTTVENVCITATVVTLTESET